MPVTAARRLAQSVCAEEAGPLSPGKWRRPVIITTADASRIETVSGFQGCRDHGHGRPTCHDARPVSGVFVRVLPASRRQCAVRACCRWAGATSGTSCAAVSAGPSAATASSRKRPAAARITAPG
eukprot:3672218-Pyramimonas_sp.AAC.1